MLDVTYQNTDRLWPVVLDEIPSSKWGERVLFFVAVYKEKVEMPIFI